MHIILHANTGTNGMGESELLVKNNVMKTLMLSTGDFVERKIAV